MKLTFLEAKIPLTKSYEIKPDGSYEGGSYPGVTNFTSHEEQIDGTKDFCNALKKHATVGNCLLTNSISSQIINESRRKLSDKDELRQWIVLDIDGIEGIVTAEDFIAKCLPEQFKSASYILQHSPSSGIKPGVRVHLFFMLYEPVDVGSVSAWLKYTNLETQLLSDQITLSNNSMALSFKLDWVANNNGRIIYITPPECKGFSDPVTDRVTWVKKKYDTVSFNFAAVGSAQMRAKYKARLNELRAAEGLKISRKDNFYVVRNNKEYVIDSLVEPARVTDPLPDNDRFMRCNLDGGDSLAYYYYRNAPVYLYNFKGEPGVKLKLVDPEFYARVAKPDRDKLREKDNRPFVFLDDVTDKYYVGIRKENEVVRQPQVRGSLAKIEDYFVQFGNTSPPTPIPTWDMIFNPTTARQWDADNKEFNVWCPTEYLIDPPKQTHPPEVITKVITHVLGDDRETYNHFINWLAFIYQNRTKSGTAWVLHGCPGTGKGVLFHQIIRPIFGNDHCQLKQIKDLADKFNGWMERCIFVNIDEANTADTPPSEARMVVNALKNWITEPTISIRHMQATASNRNSYVNFLFTTNDFGILPIQDGDRRFNVAPRQETPISLSSDEITAIHKELQAFAGYLAGFEVDELAARTPLEGEAKEELKLASQNSIDVFFRAFREGNLEFFIDGTREDTQEHESISVFRLAVEQWIEDVGNGVESRVTQEQAKHAHVVMCREKPMKLGAFRSMCSKRGSPLGNEDESAADGGWKGWRIKWNMSARARTTHKLHLRSVKTQEQMEAEITAEIKGDKNK